MPSKPAKRGRGRLQGSSRPAARVTKTKHIAAPAKNFGLRPRIQRRSYVEDDLKAFDCLSKGEYEAGDIKLGGAEIQKDVKASQHGDDEQVPEEQIDAFMTTDDIRGEMRDEDEQAPAVSTEEAVVEHLAKESHEKNVTTMVTEVEMRVQVNPQDEAMRRLYEENAQLREMLHVVLVRGQVAPEHQRESFLHLSVNVIGTAILAGCLLGMSFL
ncbi:hypothetical protein V8E51_014943 [Hyaloscypha variabilis]|jgi:hypothetical protein|uniref:Uncharacterized protein n=1 Tax=Hyaloscypha variabilis (strain UAMH 11265 / GT02V1 / F) TaxID=1149755 RepID=A0A2J6RCE8_HYAVF|nr:hypothetical protein L207DRAFT_103573 [Hyaloscypha variabilis F]